MNTMSDTYASYLRDESGHTGHADAIGFPVSVQNFTDTVRDLLHKKVPVTLQGSKTGIVGACVPGNGAIINTAKLTQVLGMNRSGNDFFIMAAPGITFSDLEQCIQTKSFDTAGWSDESKDALREFKKSDASFFLPGPTEKTAAIGGSFAAGAAGIDAKYFGSFASCVEEINVLLPSGEMWEIPKGKYIFSEDGCPLPGGGTLPFSLQKDTYALPILFGRPGMDLVDLFAGSEGMYGVVTQLKLRLIPLPAHTWGVACLFRSTGEGEAVGFADTMTRYERPGVSITAIELCDALSLHYFRKLKENSSKLSEIPDIDDEIAAIVYFEMISHDAESDNIEEALFDILAKLEGCGVQEKHTWAASGFEEIERLRVLRHAVPESINQKKDELRLSNPQLTKVSTDFSAPDKYFMQIYQMYRDDIEKSGIPAAIFGHVYNCHLHVNFLPETTEQLYNARNLLQNWAQEVQRLGGCVFTENGVGKIKRYIFSNCVPPDERQAARQTKDFFDSGRLLNPGNCFFEDAP